jgi:hypothetical protein
MLVTTGLSSRSTIERAYLLVGLYPNALAKEKKEKKNRDISCSFWLNVVTY